VPGRQAVPIVWIVGGGESLNEHVHVVMSMMSDQACERLRTWIAKGSARDRETDREFLNRIIESHRIVHTRIWMTQVKYAKKIT
jgi:hypothetical protein